MDQMTLDATTREVDCEGASKDEICLRIRGRGVAR